MKTLRDLEREWHETAEAIDVLNPVALGRSLALHACADELRRFREEWERELRVRTGKDFPLATGAICRTILGQPEGERQ